MTVYSQHANRGKVQVLATYQGSTGVVSTTVTSVESSVLAAPIVDALNRASASAAVPVSTWDRRGDRLADYPSEHLAALTDREARPDLLRGAHSLWYAQATTLLYLALVDLDVAVEALPEPVKRAISEELEAEFKGLRGELDNSADGTSLPVRRSLDFDSPFVACGDSLSGLRRRDREALNGLERGVSTSARLEKSVADLRLLLHAHAQCANSQAQLLIEGFEISDDPWGDDGERYYLNVQAPMPDGKWGRRRWAVEVCQWIPDDDENEDCATGEPILSCGRNEQPALSDIVDLLNRSNGDPQVLAMWATTAVGADLDGTAFTVTKRYGD